MQFIIRKIGGALNKNIDRLKRILMSYPKKVQCNICGWEGRHFSSDSWHKQINCPKCYSGIRQRLFFATLQYTDELSFATVIDNKKILHFAPEDIITSILQKKSKYYVTADFFRNDCDLRLDMSNMPEVKNESFDVAIGFDVLEHVPDYQKAIAEIHRILSSKGFAIFTVPQKDHLLVTYEDPSIVTPKGRTEHFGQQDHLRIFGEDITKTIESKGFKVVAVNESIFSDDLVRKHVLFPPRLSKHPLATNYRKAFFCQKTS